MKKLGILLTLFLLCFVGTALATITPTLVTPAANAIIAGPGTKAGGYNMTVTISEATISLGQDVKNVSFYITGLDGVKGYIGSSSAKNVTANQTLFWYDGYLNVSKFRDQTVTVTADAYNWTANLAGSDTSTGVVFNSSIVDGSYDSTFPADDSTVKTDITYIITSSTGEHNAAAGKEELKSAILYIGSMAHTMTATDTNKTSWSVTLGKTDIADGIYDISVKIADTDSARTVYLGTRGITYDFRDAPNPAIMLLDQGKLQAKSTTGKTNIVWILLGIVAVIAIFGKKRR